MSQYSPLYNRQDVCTYIKYIASTLVVNGHLFMYGGYKGDLTKFMNLGAQCVALFFFFSGYGLIYNYKKKGSIYLDNFFNSRLVKLIIPLIVAYVITLPVFKILKGDIDWEEVITTAIWGGPYLRYSWYVSEILVVYIVFYITMKFKCGIKQKLCILSGIILMMIATLIYYKQPLWYAISLPGVIMGLWFQYYEDKLSLILSAKRSMFFILIAAALWGVLWQWNSIRAGMFMQYRFEVGAKFLSNMLFVVIIIGLTSRLNFTPQILLYLNRFTRYTYYRIAQ